MSLQLHRPDEHGVLKPEPGPAPDYREQLRSPRWGAARGGGRMPAFRNPEMRPTSRVIAVGFWLGLAFAGLDADVELAGDAVLPQEHLLGELNLARK